jgi:hypothetical protein
LRVQGLAAVGESGEGLGQRGDAQARGGGDGEGEVGEEGGGDSAGAVVDAGAEGGPAVEVNEEGFVVFDDAVAAEDLDAEAAGEGEAVGAEAAQQGCGQGAVADEEEEGVRGLAVDAVELGFEAAADVLLDDDLGVGVCVGVSVGGEALDEGEEVGRGQGAKDAEASDVVVIGELEPDGVAEVVGALDALGDGEDLGGGEGDAEGLDVGVEGFAQELVGALGGVDDAGAVGVKGGELGEEGEVVGVAAHVKDGDVRRVGAVELGEAEVDGAGCALEEAHGVSEGAQVGADAGDHGLVGVVRGGGGLGASRGGGRGGVVEDVLGFAVDADEEVGCGRVVEGELVGCVHGVARHLSKKRASAA